MRVSLDGIPQNGWLLLESLTKMDDLGYRYFRKLPYIYNIDNGSDISHKNSDTKKA